MAYETGVASSPADLLTKLATFAVTNGWANTAASGGGLMLSKGQIVVGLNTDSDELFSRGATAVNGALAYNAQPNNSGTTHSCDLGAGPFTAYHFYSLVEEGKDLLAACVEISSGVFRHWVAADLIKFGAWTGGPYFNSQNHNDGSSEANDPYSSYHRYICDTQQSNASQSGHAWVDVDGLTNNWKLETHDGDYTASTRGPGVFRQDGMLYWFSQVGYQRFNLRTPLFPADIYVNRPSSLRSIMGRIPAFRLCSMRNHTPGEIVTIGGADFQLWPCVSRTDAWGATSTTPSSGYFGYAYKRT
jgi:hypothetical protein